MKSLMLIATTFMAFATAAPLPYSLNDALVVPRAALPEAFPQMDKFKDAAKKIGKGTKKAAVKSAKVTGKVTKAVALAPVTAGKVVVNAVKDHHEKGLTFPVDMGFPYPTD